MVVQVDVVGFADVVSDSNFLSFSIAQHISSVQVLNWFPPIFISFESVAVNPTQVLTIFHIAMPSTLIYIIVND